MGCFGANDQNKRTLNLIWGAGCWRKKLIDDLIEAGWRVPDTNFSEAAFQNWRERALICLTDLLGPEHVYVQQFNDCLRESEKLNLMAGAGVLVAAKEMARKTRPDGGRACCSEARNEILCTGS